MTRNNDSLVRGYRSRSMAAIKETDGAIRLRMQLAEAACLAHRIRSDPVFLEVFELEAEATAVRRPNKRASQFLRVLDYIELRTTPPTASRYCNVIRKCLQAGWSRKRIRHEMLSRGPTDILKTYQL
jgi:hypothetical protein